MKTDCPKCGKEKESQLASYCRECQREYGRADYIKNKAAYVAKAKRNGDRYKLEMYEWLLAFFKTHSCIDCGEKDPVVLDFDHRNGAEKEAEVFVLVSRLKRYEAAKREIEKCDVRCANCHRRKTAKEQNWYWLKFLKARTIAL